MRRGENDRHLELRAETWRSRAEQAEVENAGLRGEVAEYQSNLRQLVDGLGLENRRLRETNARLRAVADAAFQVHELTRDYPDECPLCTALIALERADG